MGKGCVLLPLLNNIIILLTVNVFKWWEELFGKKREFDVEKYFTNFKKIERKKKVIKRLIKINELEATKTDLVYSIVQSINKLI